MSPLELIMGDRGLLPGLGCPLELLLRLSIYHPSQLLESIRPQKSSPNPVSSKRQRIKRGLISYSTLPIAHLLSAVTYCCVAATSSVRQHVP
ncbi:hypothetical protein L3X38_040846 [Prunus dulcis]|uniref:Uncharacterized protein n=1 Tax=Prunus dulcis TaxID=3755 RepID=A0AAD4US33_PRUDU|nr:hypothetical protein L3X38_040846 [Prunus dulcis]